MGGGQEGGEEKFTKCQGAHRVYAAREAEKDGEGGYCGDRLEKSREGGGC